MSMYEELKMLFDDFDDEYMRYNRAYLTYHNNPEMFDRPSREMLDIVEKFIGNFVAAHFRLRDVLLKETELMDIEDAKD